MQYRINTATGTITVRERQQPTSPTTNSRFRLVHHISPTTGKCSSYYRDTITGIRYPAWIPLQLLSLLAQ